MRIFKFLYYGNFDVFDFRVYVIVVFINEGRGYILKVKLYNLFVLLFNFCLINFYCLFFC